MDKRYQVFVSSTFLDLKLERSKVMESLLELDCFPAAMELFPSSDSTAWEWIQRVIQDSDYYLVIIGNRYGSVDDQGLSYTEKEYDYAVSLKKPVMAFLHSDPGSIPSKLSDKDPEVAKKLDAFRQKVRARLCKDWNGADHLASVVSRSITQLKKTHPAVGWIRANQGASPEQLERQEELRREVEELRAQLQRAKTEAPPGTEGLAQGEEEVELELSFRLYGEYTHETVAPTWDAILATIGPAMLDEASEAKIDGLLLDLLIRYVEARPQGTPEVRHDSMLQVVSQFQALGVIKLSEKKRSASDRETYWTLTEYGRTQVMRLRAVRRGQRVPPIDVGE